jgi:hypothetical protein
VFVVNKDDPVSCDFFLWCFKFFRASSGNPSHLLFTLGTYSGSFWVETLVRPTALALAAFSAAAFFCSAANCSNAFVEGSFSVRKPSIPPFFLSFVCCCCGCFPCDDPLFRAAVSMPLGLERWEASLIPRSRRGDAVRVLDCEDAVWEALLLLLEASVPALFRTASLGTRTLGAALATLG